MSNEECLTTKAMNECQCQYCKLYRQVRATSIVMQVGSDLMKEFYKITKETSESSPKANNDKEVANGKRIR